MVQATTKSVNIRKDIADLVAAFDGKWQKKKPCLSQRCCVCNIIREQKSSCFWALTKHCFYCKNQNGNEDDCQKYFKLYSEEKEAERVLKIFQRSVELQNARYEKYVGDGDSKRFRKVFEPIKVRADGSEVENLALGILKKERGEDWEVLVPTWRRKNNLMAHVYLDVVVRQKRK